MPCVSVIVIAEHVAAVAIVEFKKEVYRSALNALRNNFCEEINND